MGEDNTFALRLKSVRKKRNISMDELVSKMEGKVSKQSISKYENGKMMPDSSTLISLASALDVNVDYFFQPLKYDISSCNIAFRKKAKLGKKKIDSIKEEVAEKINQYLEIEDILDEKKENASFNFFFKTDCKNDAANAADAEKSSDEEQAGLPEVSLAETPDISTQDEERQETEGNQADKTQSAGEKDQDSADKNEDSRPTGSTSQRPSTDASRPSNPGTSTPSEPTPEPEPTPDPEPEPAPEPEPEPEDPMLQEPSAEDEQVFRAFLANKASLIPGYVSQVNACVGAFEANCLTTDISVRLAGQSSCESLAYQLLNEYFAVRDHVRSNYSQYCDEQDELINMYRLLETYVECYYAAWTINVGFEDPSQHTSEFMAPLSGASSYLAEFDAYYAGFSI